MRILVIGTASHQGPTLTSVPAAGRSAEAVGAALIAVGGAAPENVRVVVDPPDVDAMSALVAEAEEAAESVLLIYYVGHGLIGPRNQLYLAACATDVVTGPRPHRQALPFREIADTLSGSQVKTRIVILDCCFSGRAELPDAALPTMPGFSPAAASGTYLLASAERLAEAPPGEELTTFSGRFVRLLEKGDARAGSVLTLDAIYERLATAAGEGQARPTSRSGDGSGTFPLAVNRAHPVAGPHQLVAPADGQCPYLGLDAFGLKDAKRYFGRDETIAGLVAVVAGAAEASLPSMLVAASGAGKTSLLNAGLRPALAAGAPGLPGSSGWPVLLMIPDEHPVDQLVHRLSKEAGWPPELSMTTGEGATPAEPALVVRLAEAACKKQSVSRLVFIVDQLEQVFTLCESPAERASFLGAVRALAERHVVVLALRADFYGVAAERPELTDALRHHQTLITAMTPAEMRAAIVEPAVASGWHVDDGLAALILRDLGEQDRLPLLSHALLATWGQREGNRITLGGYGRAGGMAAIGTSAEAAWASIAKDEAEAAALRRMLPRLVRVGGEGPETIRPVPIDDLLRGLDDPAAGERALERFTGDRLITRDSTSVRLSHEALLRSWPRLRDWIDEDHDRLRTAQRLTADAQIWAEAGRDPALLYRGARLGVAAEAAAELGPEATTFLASSRSAQRRSERIRRSVISVLAALLVVALGAAITAVVFQGQAADQRDLAIAGLLAAEAGQLRDRQPNLAKQLSVLSYRLDPATGTGPVLASLASTGTLNAGRVAYDLAQSGDGAFVAVSTGDTLVLRDPRSVTVVSEFGAGELNGPVALSTDGRLLAVGVGPDSPDSNTEDMRDLPRPQVRLYNLTDPAHPVSLAVLETGDTSITAVALTADGKTLAAAGHNGDIRLWDVTQPAQPRETGTIDAHQGMVDSLAFAPSGLLLASAGLDKKSRLWAVPERAKRAEWTSPADWILKPRVFMHRVAFDRTGRYLVTVAGTSGHEYPRIWDIGNPRKVSAVTDDKNWDSPYGNTCSYVSSLVYSRDREDDRFGYVVGGGDGVLCVWRKLSDGLWFASNTSAGTAHSLGAAVILKSAPPEYPLVATPTDSGVLLWDVADAFRPGATGSMPLLKASLLNGVTFNPQGPKLVADTSSNIGTRVWDITDPRSPVPVRDFPSHGTNMFVEAGEGIDQSTAFSPDGTLFAVPRTDGNQALVDIVATGEMTAATYVKPGKPLATLSDFTSGAMGLTFGGGNGRMLAVADVAHRDDGRPSSMRLFDLSDPAAPKLLVNLPTVAYEFAFSTRGPFLYSFSDNEILAWDIGDPANPRPLGSRPATADSLLVDGQLTSDGRYLVAGDNSRYVRIFPVGDDGRLGEPMLLGGRRSFVNTDLALSPDGKLLALPGGEASSDGLVDLFDISDPRTARLNATMAVNNTLNGLAFSPDGKLLAVRGRDGVDFWSTDPEEVIPRVCASAGDPISRREWETYVPGLPYKPPC
ncbi:WD40 repeat protein [Actinoplanes tereljensis]|uniref:WD40 repeat domain-containing protein n=1 Tax=Paractinoplanes tereljensis TaxID=571912 RepID=UPI001941E249|nr:WD40 repeat domain-containing protein [Actinoplanes tereljensis]